MEKPQIVYLRRVSHRDHPVTFMGVRAYCEQCERDLTHEETRELGAPELRPVSEAEEECDELGAALETLGFRGAKKKLRKLARAIETVDEKAGKIEEKGMSIARALSAGAKIGKRIGRLLPRDETPRRVVPRTKAS